MIIIVGLGNPGDTYRNSRHNVGFVAIDILAKVLGFSQLMPKAKLHGDVLKQGDLVLLKPTTFMNKSGEAVRTVIDYYSSMPAKNQPITNLFVIHDDLDIPLGSFKIQLGTGPKQHNGLLSLYEHLGTTQFWHVRIGVDGRDGDRTMPPDRYVLQLPPPVEQQQLNQTITSVVAALRRQIQK